MDDYVFFVYDQLDNVLFHIDLYFEFDILFYFDFNIFDNDARVMENVSIVFTHWAQDEERSQMMRRSINSLLLTTPKAQIIVCDNGDNKADSVWLFDLCTSGIIASYTRYRHNMQLGYARNDAIRRASRPYLVIVDNDIEFEIGWLEECVAWLESTPGKFLATPLLPDPMNNIREERWQGEANEWRLNTRAGSNAFVLTREAADEIGPFQDNSTICGSRYCDMWNRKGYLMGVMPTPKAKDLGLRKGANWKKATFPDL